MSGLASLLRPFTFKVPARQTDDDDATAKTRANGYGEMYVQPTGDRFDPLLAEGSLFVANNYNLTGATSNVGTGVALGAAAQTAFAETACGLALINGAAPGQNAIRVRPDFLRMIATAANVGAAGLDIVFTLDDAVRFAPNQAGLTQLATMQPSNGQLKATTAIYAGAIALSAPTAKRKIIGRAKLKTAALVVGDEFLLQFNGSDAKTSAASLAGTVATNYSRAMPSIVIEAGQALFMHCWATGQTGAPSFEIESQFIER